MEQEKKTSINTATDTIYLNAFHSDINLLSDAYMLQ